MEQKPLIERTISGITGKQIISLIIIVSTVVVLYLRIEALARDGLKQSKENGMVLKEMQTERKELVRINDIRLNKLELEISECRIRITNIEKQIIKN